VPIILTAQQRRVIREREERERAAREAEEKRNRDLLAAYTGALDRLRNDRDDAAMANLARERESLTLPYDIWGGAARRLILLIAFDELAKQGLEGAPQISEFMTKAAKSAGLTHEDEVATKADFYATILWHLLADDHLGTARAERLATLRNALKIDDVDANAQEQLRRLRGITSRNLPHVDAAATKLAFQEYAILNSDKLIVTNRRLIVNGKKAVEVPLPQVNDIDVDVDANVTSIDTATTKKPIQVTVDDAIYVAAIIDLAANMVERPRWQ